MLEASSHSIHFWSVVLAQAEGRVVTISWVNPLLHSVTPETSPETQQQAWRRTGRPRRLIKSSWINRWREEEKWGCTQELLPSCRLLFRLKIGSKERPIGHDVLPPVTTQTVT